MGDSDLRGRVAMGLAAFMVASCAALDWLAEPACPCPPGRGRREGEAVPGGTGLPGPSLPGAPHAAPDAPGAGHAGRGLDSRPSRGEALARGAARVGGLVTGNPIAWTLAGQLVAAGAAQISRRRRKDSTA